MVLWIPRTVLLPLYLVSEYVVRRPVHATMIYVEQHHVPEKFLYYTSFGTYGTENELQLLPTAELEWGVRANGGASFTWKRRDNLLSTGFAIGGPDWIRFGIEDRVPLGRDRALTANADYERRGDFRFWGLGPSSPSQGYHFTVTRPNTMLRYEQRLWRSSSFEASAGLRTASFQKWAVKTPTLESGLASGAIGEPPGFADYSLAVQRVTGALDSRRARAEDPRDRSRDLVTPSGTGVRVEGDVEHSLELGKRTGEWIRYGGGLGLYADVFGRNRTLGLSVSTELLTGFRDAQVPFLELVTLGGAEPMRAFRYYRLLGTSSVTAKLGYTWPIWTGLDAVAEAALGNVFGDYYDGFATRLLRGSFSVGIQTASARDTAFQILLGAGTRTIDDGFAIEQFRFVVGTGTSF